MRKPYQVREVGYKGTRYGRQIFHVCTHCGQIATKEALFRNGNATVIEKYCSDCMQEEKFTAIMTFYSRNKNQEREKKRERNWGENP